LKIGLSPRPLVRSGHSLGGLLYIVPKEKDLARDIFNLANFCPSRSFERGCQTNEYDGDNHRAAIYHIGLLRKPVEHLPSRK
jgi:hypothetical protein